MYLPTCSIVPDVWAMARTVAVADFDGRIVLFLRVQIPGWSALFS